MAIVAYSLDSILDALNRFHQRATYGAVAALVDRQIHHLMDGQPRDRRHSWVVSPNTRLPVGYSRVEIHPDIIERATVLTSPEELEGWLRDPS